MTVIPAHSLRCIKEVFPCANRTEILLPAIGKGLAIHFREQADFFGELGVSPESGFYHSDLYRLVETFGFIVLKNCRVNGIDKNQSLKLSQARSSSMNLMQAPPHRDKFYAKPDMVSAIYPTSPEGRSIPTYYAPATSVRTAIDRLRNQMTTQGHVSRHLHAAMWNMQQPSYPFMLNDPEDNARKTLLRDLSSFTQLVFDLIPDQEKYCQNWLAGQWDVAIQSNSLDENGEGILHARPAGKVNSSQNPNPHRGLEIHRR